MVKLRPRPDLISTFSRIIAFGRFIKMNKADFVAAVAEKTDLSKAAAAGAVESVGSGATTDAK